MPVTDILNDPAFAAAEAELLAGTGGGTEDGATGGSDRSEELDPTPGSDSSTDSETPQQRAERLRKELEEAEAEAGATGDSTSDASDTRTLDTTTGSGGAPDTSTGGSTMTNPFAQIVTDSKATATSNRQVLGDFIDTWEKGVKDNDQAALTALADALTKDPYKGLEADLPARIVTKLAEVRGTVATTTTPGSPARVPVATVGDRKAYDVGDSWEVEVPNAATQTFLKSSCASSHQAIAMSFINTGTPVANNGTSTAGRPKPVPDMKANGFSVYKMDDGKLNVFSDRTDQNEIVTEADWNGPKRTEIMRRLNQRGAGSGILGAIFR